MAVRVPERLIITTDSVGGIWRYCVDVAAELQRRGSQVTIAGFGPEPSPGQVQESSAAGAELVWLDAPLDWTTTGPEGAEAGGAGLNDLLRRRRPDLLHLNAPPLAPYLDTSVPCLVAAHSCLGTWWERMRAEPLPAEWQAHAQAMGRGLRAADLVVSPTAAFAAALQRVYGKLPAVRVVANGSRPIAPAAQKGEFVFAAGRWWDEAKNLECLEAAARAIGWPLKAAGPLEGPKSRAPAVKHVTCLGSLDHQEVAQWLARAPIFVSPARYEPFGLAVLEAASAGAALVLADIPSFRELWGDCAVFLDPGRPDDWAVVVNRLIDDPAARDLLGCQAQQRAASYTLERQADGLLKAYHRAVDARMQTA